MTLFPVAIMLLSVQMDQTMHPVVSWTMCNFVSLLRHSASSLVTFDTTSFPFACVIPGVLLKESLLQ